MAIEGRTDKPVIDNKKCVQCSTCRYYCPELCITIRQDTHQMEIDYDYCKGCGICISVCPKKANTMVREV